eukprot:ANDGO_00044.mRNA.1 Protein FAM91 homolog
MDELLSHLKKETRYEDLPPSVCHVLGNNQDVYHRRLLEHSYQYRKAYGSLGSITAFPNNKLAYYKQLTLYLKQNLRVFPYEHASIVIDALLITPFSYYRDMLAELMKNEQPYDSLPNFSAVDALRWVGVGRNEFIDSMNECRAKRFMWKVNKSQVVSQILPKTPHLDNLIASIKPYMKQHVVIQNVPSQMQENFKNPAVLLEFEDPFNQTLSGSTLDSLIVADAVYFTVQILQGETFLIPPMSGFVMNRSINVTDPFEKLLYDILVSLDERSTPQQIAQMLDVDYEFIEAAFALCCQLGLLVKKVESSKVHRSGPQPTTTTTDAQTVPPAQIASATTPFDSFTAEQPSSEQESLASGANEFEELLEEEKSDASVIRIGFLFSAELAAELMAGSYSKALKELSVTLYEAGKLTHEKLTPLLSVLDATQEPSFEMEGEARKFAEHASLLAKSLRFLTALPHVHLDMVRAESVSQLEPSIMMRLLEDHYDVLIPTAPLGSMMKITRRLSHYFGSPIPLWDTAWSRLYLWSLLVSRGGCCPPFLVIPHGTVLSRVPTVFDTTDDWTIATNRICILPFMSSAEPTHVPRNSCLHWLNDALSRSAILAYPTPTEEWMGGGTVDELTAALQSPITSSFGYVAYASWGSTKHTVMSVQFGLPLHTANLNSGVCSGVIGSHADFFSPENISVHEKEMSMLEQSFGSFVTTLGGDLSGNVHKPFQILQRG